MKWILWTVVLLVQGAVFSASSFAMSVEEMEILAEYVGDRIEAEDVNCSNILNFVETYLKLSSANQLLLNVSAQRLLAKENKAIEKAVSSPGDSTESEDKHSCSGQGADGQNELACVVHFIEENESTLSEQADVILSVLPTCLANSK